MRLVEVCGTAVLPAGCLPRDLLSRTLLGIGVDGHALGLPVSATTKMIPRTIYPDSSDRVHVRNQPAYGVSVRIAASCAATRGAYGLHFWQTHRRLVRAAKGHRFLTSVRSPRSLMSSVWSRFHVKHRQTALLEVLQHYPRHLHISSCRPGWRPWWSNREYALVPAPFTSKEDIHRST